jgi:transcription elongation factor GreA
MSTAAELLREVGLLADGPVLFGRPGGSRNPGIYLVELATPVATAPLEHTRIVKWLERVPGLRLDGERPTPKQLLARLGAFWLPEQPVVYAGATRQTGTTAGRIASLANHVPGDRQPHPDGQWLHLLLRAREARVWWAATKAPEEYLDAVLEAFAAGVGADERAGLPSRTPVLPWAVMRRPTGERKVTGITGTVLPAPPAEAPVERRTVDLAPGDADGIGEPEPPRRGRRVTAAGSTPAKPRATRSVTSRTSTGRAASGAGAGGRGGPRATTAAGAADRAAGARASGSDGGATAELDADGIGATTLTPEGLARLTAEREELSQVRRPGVIARVKAARELGDLRENSEYQAAREEQSFLEGRIQAIDAILRVAVVVGAPAPSGDDGPPIARLGSEVVLEHDGDSMVLNLVGPAEADLAAGRVSTASPVGRAVLGRRQGDDVVVRTPGGELTYRLVEVR